MASAEQPPKKRRLYEPLEEPPHPPLSEPPPPQKLDQDQSSVAPPPTPPPLSQDEILLRRRNRDEIRSVYDCYKRIRFCLSQKDDASMPDIEQAYLSLLSASRGCASVQRIVADLIPRYASHCPTALEAAAKVVINMHNWSLAVINRGDVADEVAFQTAKACIFGLVDICCTASSEAPTSSVIRGICSAVFQNVLTFFMSSFEEKDIFQIVDKENLKMQDSADIFTELKQKLSDEDASSLVKLSKFRALSLLRIFFCCPKNLLAASFELLNSSVVEGVNKESECFLRQVTSKLVHDVASVSDKTSDRAESRTGSVERSMKGSEELISDGNHFSGDALPAPESCLLALVLGKDRSLQRWIFSKFKKLNNSSFSSTVSDILSALEGIIQSFKEAISVEGRLVDSDEDDPDSSKYVNQRYSVHRISNQHEHSDDPSGKKGSAHDIGGSRPMDFESGENSDVSRGRSSGELFSPARRTPLHFRSNSFEGRSNSFNVEKNQVSNMDSSMSTMRSSCGGINNALTSPQHHLGMPCNSTTQIVWHSDGDPAAMDIVSASKQLWVGFSGSDTSEAHIRFQFERFGPIEQFIFFPVKGFALVEYRNIIDAIKAREYMRRHFPWRIKFIDVGLGTRGAMNGVAVGSSSHVYVGNVSSQWAKDEILHESRKVVYKGPYTVTELFSEGALLMEFESPEEAASVMAHLRQQRKERSNYRAPLNVGPSNVAVPLIDGARSVPTHVDARNSNLGTISSNSIGSPHPRTVPGSPADSCRMRMPHLSSLLSSLRTKYNINQNSSFFDNYISGNSHTAMTREEDKVPSNTLWISLPNISSPFLTDDELMAICSLAVSNVGSVVRLTRANIQMGCSWFVECSSVDAAITILKNLRGSPGLFFQIEFSQPGKQHPAPFSMKNESSSMELVSPRMKLDNHANTVHCGYSFQSNWAVSGEMPEVGGRKVDGYDSSAGLDPSQGGGHGVSGSAEQMWMYKKPEIELHSAPVNIPCMPFAAQGPPIPSPQQIQSSSYMRPVYLPPNSSWDARGLHHQMPLNPVSPGVMTNSFHGNAVAAPFIPASVTPLAQIQGAPMHHFDQMFSLPVAPPPLSSLPPPQPEMPPPLPPSPPPLPQSKPPSVPPPPSSPPPPPPIVEPSKTESSGQCPEHQWQGTLCKSGVHYCTVYAHRLDSDICKYSNALSEPSEWPAKLDMTKRTDFRHVRSTFTSAPPHKREVCQLIPSSAGDRKGVSYLNIYLDSVL
ncbi:hypothetical protein I3843_07G173000 [Carya illinoinensis]|nr:hypothetical protein I3760_07G173300 [Carya illinoinensis]KAG7972241.1 hypothetical protein I3843_07G173000 [Carya illinoinensis]